MFSYQEKQHQRTVTPVEEMQDFNAIKIFGGQFCIVVPLH